MELVLRYPEDGLLLIGAIYTNMYASKTQIIKLVDDEAPLLENCTEGLEVYGEGLDCNLISVNIENKANDNCTTVNHLIWSVIIDEYSASP
jgi:hypothetical protein